MHFDIKLLDEKNAAWFEGLRELPSEVFLKMAAERKPLLMEKGMDFAQGGVNVMGGELVKVVKAGANEAEVDQAMIGFALAVVALELCLGTEERVLANRTFYLTVYQDGAVRYDRVDGQSA